MTARHPHIFSILIGDASRDGHEQVDTFVLRDLAAVDLPAALRERLMTARSLR
jgi:hypothetical protein